MFLEIYCWKSSLKIFPTAVHMALTYNLDSRLMHTTCSFVISVGCTTTDLDETDSSNASKCIVMVRTSYFVTIITFALLFTG